MGTDKRDNQASSSTEQAPDSHQRRAEKKGVRSDWTAVCSCHRTQHEMATNLFVHSQLGILDQPHPHAVRPALTATIAGQTNNSKQ